jgi:putative phosphoribosyl transferase
MADETDDTVGGRVRTGPGADARVTAELIIESEVTVTADGVRLPGVLAVPAPAVGVVVFAHGSGSSRHSARNRRVAARLQVAGFATLLFDLLTDDEADDRANVFDIGLLAGRLTGAVAWVRQRPDLAALPVGLFGASTGAAAALAVAARNDAGLAAVVSRGGRPDLAGPWLARVRVPTLLLVGGLDGTVLGLNRQAERDLACEHRLDVIPGATHLFDEPGTLDRVAEHAVAWFAGHCGQSGTAARSGPPR